MKEISLKTLKKNFEDNLMNRYSDTEVNTIFKWLIDDFFKATSTDILMNKSILSSADTLADYKNAVARLQKGEPIQYILGYTEFHNCRIKVNKDVLIPRPETEVLVDWIISDIDQIQNADLHKIIDLGTGSGCIAIALAKHLKQPIQAIDISPEALRLAQDNTELNQVKVDFKCLDMNRLDDLEEVPDIIVSNPPYVLETEKNQLESNVIDYEPHLALFSEDPINFYNLIFNYVHQHPKVKYVYLELNHLTADEVSDKFKSINHKFCSIRKDMRGNKRFLKWQRS